MKEDPRYYLEYSIKEGDTPEIIADKFYDDATYAWIVLDFNTIVDVFEEWPKDQYALDQYIIEKYENPFDIHHWVSIETGDIVCPLNYPEYNRVPVTNTEYEYNENDLKRDIKLVLPEYIGTIVSRHKELMRKGV
jgi:hypothetical protein